MWKRVFQAKRTKNQAGIVILVSDKTGFRSKLIRRDIEGQYVPIKEKLFIEDCSNSELYSPNDGVPIP